MEILLPHSLRLSSGHLSVSSSSVTGAPLEPAGWFGKPRRSFLRWPSLQGQKSHDFCPSLPLITSAQLSHRAVSPPPPPSPQKKPPSPLGPPASELSLTFCSCWDHSLAPGLVYLVLGKEPRALDQQSPSTPHEWWLGGPPVVRVVVTVSRLCFAGEQGLMAWRSEACSRRRS